MSSGDSGLDCWTCQIPHLLLAGVPWAVAGVDVVGDGGGAVDVSVLIDLLGLVGEVPASPWAPDPLVGIASCLVGLLGPC